MDNKLTTIADDSLTISKTSGLQTALNGKQATIADGDLTIAKTNGLQSALNNKAESSTLAHYVTSSVFGMSLAAKQDILSSASNLKSCFGRLGECKPC